MHATCRPNHWNLKNLYFRAFKCICILFLPKRRKCDTKLTPLFLFHVLIDTHSNSLYRPLADELGKVGWKSGSRLFCLPLFFYVTISAHAACYRRGVTWVRKYTMVTRLVLLGTLGDKGPTERTHAVGLTLPNPEGVFWGTQGCGRRKACVLIQTCARTRCGMLDEWPELPVSPSVSGKDNTCLEGDGWDFNEIRQGGW